MLLSLTPQPLPVVFLGTEYNTLLRKMELKSPWLREPNVVCPPVFSNSPICGLGFLFVVSQGIEYPSNPNLQAYLGAKVISEPASLKVSDSLIPSAQLTDQGLYAILSKNNEDSLVKGISLIRLTEQYYSQTRQSMLLRVVNPEDMGQAMLVPGSHAYPLSYEFGSLPPIDQEKKTAFVVLPSLYKDYEELVIKPQGLVSMDDGFFTSLKEKGLGTEYMMSDGLYVPRSSLGKTFGDLVRSFFSSIGSLADAALGQTEAQSQFQGAFSQTNGSSLAEDEVGMPESLPPLPGQKIKARLPKSLSRKGGEVRMIFDEEKRPRDKKYN